MALGDIELDAMTEAYLAAAIAEGLRRGPSYRLRTRGL
jgi:hypothetical protein